MTPGCAEPSHPRQERATLAQPQAQGIPFLGSFQDLPALALRSSGVTMTTKRMARSLRNIS